MPKPLAYLGLALIVALFLLYASRESLIPRVIHHEPLYCSRDQPEPNRAKHEAKRTLQPGSAGVTEPNARQSLELVLVVGAARCKRLLGAAESLLDILPEIGIEDREGAGEAGEVLLGDEQHDGILERHDEPGAQRRFEQHPLAEMIAGAEHLLEMLAGLGVVDGEPEASL